MSLLDAILGRTKPAKSSLDQLFGLSTGEITLQTELDLASTNRAGISFRPVSSGEFSELSKEIDDLLKASTKDSPLSWNNFTDSFGYRWLILQAGEFSNLVATIHMVSRELQDSGFGEQLLASVFQFKEASGGRNVYWMYNYKRGTFYPFVPGPNQSRDNATELRLSTVMARELKIEGDLTMWFPMWGIPMEGPGT